MTDLPKLEVMINLEKPLSSKGQQQALDFLRSAQDESIRAYEYFLQITEINGQEAFPVSLKLHLGTNLRRELYSLLYKTKDGKTTGRNFSKEEFYSLR